MTHNKGFTLMELMVSIAIMSILVCIAVPEFKQWNATQTLSSSVRRVHSVFQLSRMEAIKEGRDVVMLFSEGAGSAGTYSSFVDDDGDRVQDAGEKLIVSGSLPDNITLSRARFDFAGSGTLNKLKTHFDSRGLTTGRNGEIRMTNLYGKVISVILNSAGSSRIDSM
ncbi:GspH/FimT family pseudopilin [Desulfoluna sp.]|uniref:GspH/FimT family pseudopilin n=1 Tax=Desulfoluna sp. TaxID=2045199 RepID=UPI00261886FB|nr:GspH/FimT family pseudopilin [Desulfoluna sp.]